MSPVPAAISLGAVSAVAVLARLEALSIALGTEFVFDSVDPVEVEVEKLL